MMTLQGTLDVSDLLEQGYIRVERDYPIDDGFVHNCIGCAEENPIGLKLAFYGVPGSKEVVTRYAVGKNFCGFPLFAHGGTIALLFDEILAYATYHVHGRFGLTKSMQIQFKKPVLIGKEHFLVAGVTASVPHPKGHEVTVEGSIHQGRDTSGETCAMATGTLVVIDQEHLKRAYKQD